MTIKNPFIFNLIFYISFVLGGLLQLFLGLSYTITNIFLLFLMLFALFLKRKRKIDKKVLIVSVLIILQIIISGFINRKGLKFQVPYLIYVLVPLITFIYLINFLNRKNIYNIFKKMLLVSYFQFPIIFLQRLFFPDLLRFINKPFLELDIDFGTFFLATDHVLGFFINCIILSLLIKPSLIKKKSNYIITIVYLSITVFSLNSKFSIILLLLIYLIYFLNKINIKRIIQGFSLIVILLIVIFSSGLGDQLIFNYNDFATAISQNIVPNKAFIDFAQGKGNRVLTIYALLNSRLYIMGNGPYSVYNPYSKQFLQGGDFSQFIWFYSDIGAIGLLLAILLVYFILHYNNSINIYSLTIFIIVILYSLVFNSFADVPFYFIFIFYSIFINHINNIETTNESNRLSVS